jgi:hypothetical protein
LALRGLIMKLSLFILVFISKFAFAQYNEPNIKPGQNDPNFKTEIQLGGESFHSENVTTVVPFGSEDKPRFHAIFTEHGIKLGNKEFSAKLLPFTIKLTANSDEKWDEANIKTLAQRIRGEVSRFFFNPESAPDLFMNVGVIAFDYKKIGPQALHPAGIEVTQMDVADLNLGYRIHDVSGKWQIIFSGYAAVQMVNVHDQDFLDHNNQLLGKNVAGTYGLSIWGEYQDFAKLNISWYHQQSKLANRDLVEGDMLGWSHQSLSAGLELSLGKLVHKNLSNVSLMLRYNMNIATINDVSNRNRPVEMQKINQNNFEVGLKITIGGKKKKPRPTNF